MNVRKKLDTDELAEFIAQQEPTTKIYVGGDSERVKINGMWYADYAVCVVVHINGNRGCRVFGEVTREVDYDQRKDKPRLRLMNEVYKIAEMFLRIKDIIGDLHAEVHIDVNPDERWGSNVVINEAVGYIKGTCNVIPLVKPNSPAATFCADRFATLKSRKKA